MRPNLGTVGRRGNVRELGEPRVEASANFDKAFRVVVHKILVSLLVYIYNMNLGLVSV